MRWQRDFGLCHRRAVLVVTRLRIGIELRARRGCLERQPGDEHGVAFLERCLVEEVVLAEKLALLAVVEYSEATAERFVCLARRA